MEAFQNGRVGAMKELLEKVSLHLSAVIQIMSQGTKMDDEERQRLMSMITFDVHARDVVCQLMQQKMYSPQAFRWQAQLKPR